MAKAVNKDNKIIPYDIISFNKNNTDSKESVYYGVNNIYFVTCVNQYEGETEEFPEGFDNYTGNTSETDEFTAVYDCKLELMFEDIDYENYITSKEKICKLHYFDIDNPNNLSYNYIIIDKETKNIIYRGKDKTRNIESYEKDRYWFGNALIRVDYGEIINTRYNLVINKKTDKPIIKFKDSYGLLAYYDDMLGELVASEHIICDDCYNAYFVDDFLNPTIIYNISDSIFDYEEWVYENPIKETETDDIISINDFYSYNKNTKKLTVHKEDGDYIDIPTNIDYSDLYEFKNI